MGTTLNRHAYQRLIDEDLAWLEKQPRSLEREHIKDIVRLSPSREYSNPATTPLDFTEQARQLVQSVFAYGAYNELREYKQLVTAIASFAAEAATAALEQEQIRIRESVSAIAADETHVCDSLDKVLRVVAIGDDSEHGNRD